MTPAAVNWSTFSPRVGGNSALPDDFDLGGSSTLDLSEYRISPALVSYVTKSTTVEWLRIWGARADDLKWVSKLTQLKGLSLVRGDLTGSDLSVLNKLKWLEWLEVSGGTFEKVKPHLGLMPHLECVKYKSRSSTDEFVTGLRSCPRLRALSLATSSVSDASIGELASSHQGLRTLSVFRTQVTEAAIGDFEKLTELRFLAIGMTKLFPSPPFADAASASQAEKRLEQLRAVLPKCSIDSGN
jgi:Leucine-rich repeat (LRR) protein